jgi:hypothetical protein
MCRCSSMRVRDWAPLRVTRRLALWAVKLRYALLMSWATVWFGWQYPARPGDWLYFEEASRVLMHFSPAFGIDGGPLHLYADMPFLQIGPPAVLATIPSQLLGHRVGQATAAVALMALGVFCIRQLELSAVALGATRARCAAVALVGGVILLPVWSTAAIWWMHLDDVIALALVTLAMPAIARNRWWLAALALGTAAASKPWAVIVLPMLLALPARDRARAIIAAVVTCALWWLPFVLADPSTVQALGRIQISTSADSSLRALGWSSPWSPTWMRWAQFVAGAVVVALVVRRGRWVAAPLAGFAVRVALDSQTYSYYGVGPVLGALAVDIHGRHRVPVWTIGAVAIEYGLPALADGVLVGVVRFMACAGVVAFLVFRRTGAPTPVPVRKTDLARAPALDALAS